MSVSAAATPVAGMTLRISLDHVTTAQHHHLHHHVTTAEADTTADHQVYPLIVATTVGDMNTALMTGPDFPPTQRPILMNWMTKLEKWTLIVPVNHLTAVITSVAHSVTAEDDNRSSVIDTRQATLQTVLNNTLGSSQRSVCSIPCRVRHLTPAILVQEAGHTSLTPDRTLQKVVTATVLADAEKSTELGRAEHGTRKGSNRSTPHRGKLKWKHSANE